VVFREVYGLKPCDFHSRNIMQIDEKTLGIIDYQDAMSGAVTYDLVSLLKDLYIRFELQRVEKLALYFRDKKALKVSDAEFIRWFDFMGLQRHIKVLGLKDLPLTLKYVLETSAKYGQTKELYEFLNKLNLKSIS